MRTLNRPAALIAAVTLTIGLLAGCSASVSTDTAASAPAASDVGAGLMPPIFVDPGQTEATAAVGDNIVFNIPEADLAGTTISTDKPEILEVTQAKQEGDALFNPGAKALAPGTATVTVTAPDMTTTDVTITVTE
ncbi:MAG: hypothetical protein ACKOE2_04100 [Actinomycetales bacterium]